MGSHLRTIRAGLAFVHDAWRPVYPQYTHSSALHRAPIGECATAREYRCCVALFDPRTLGHVALRVETEAPRLWLAYGEAIENFHDMPKPERLPRARAALMQASNHLCGADWSRTILLLRTALSRAQGRHCYRS